MIEITKGIDFSELCITSAVEIKKDTSEEIIETIKAEGNKCPVCWKIKKGDCEKHSFN